VLDDYANGMTSFVDAITNDRPWNASSIIVAASKNGSEVAEMGSALLQVLSQGDMQLSAAADALARAADIGKP
jgi:hypothetical protein